MLTAFCDWMRRQRGVSDATLSIYRFELRAFIKDLGEDPHMYDARNLRQFVLDKSQHSGWASARKCICAVRMFLRFLISQEGAPTISMRQSLLSPIGGSLLCHSIYKPIRSNRSSRRQIWRVRSEGETERFFYCSHVWGFGRATLFSFGSTTSIGEKE